MVDEFTREKAYDWGLKDVFRDIFKIGVALNLDQIKGREPATTTVVARHFNSLTPENLLKWEAVHPAPEYYDFDAADAYVAFGEKQRKQIIGHTLVWFYQTPDWVFRDAAGRFLDRPALLERMRDHIHTVMGRYKGRIHGWDVVNEAIVPDGQFRQCPWLEIIGEDYVQKAFEFAREADPGAQLYYNDYNYWKPGQCNGVIKLIRRLQAAGVQPDGLGIQGHWGLDYPELGRIEQFINELTPLGIPLMMTEMDLTVLPFAEEHVNKRLSELDPDLQKRINPYPSVLPETVLQDQAQRWARPCTPPGSGIKIKDALLISKTSLSLSSFSTRNAVKNRSRKTCRLTVNSGSCLKRSVSAFAGCRATIRSKSGRNLSDRFKSYRNKTHPQIFYGTIYNLFASQLHVTGKLI